MAAEGTIFIFNRFKEEFAGGTIPFITGQFKFALITGATAPDITTLRFWNELSSRDHPNSGTYVTGGKSLTTITKGFNAGFGVLTTASISWPGSTIVSVTFGVLYKSGGTPGVDDFLIAYGDFNGAKSTNNSTFTWNWNAAGMLTVG